MKNYFELLQIPIHIKIDQALLNKKFYALIKKNHPDFVQNASVAEKEQSLQITADLNEAKKIFSDENKTISYILQLKHVIVPNEKYELNKSFLLDMLEINEALMEAKISNSTTTINAIKQQLLEQKNILYQAIESIVIGYNDHTITQGDLQKLKDYYYKMQYIKRIEEKI